MLYDADGQAFSDGRLAHTRLTYEDGVIFLAAAENLGDAFQLAFTTYDGVKAVFLGGFGEVAAEVVEHWRLALGGRSLLGLFLLRPDFVHQVVFFLLVIIIEDVGSVALLLFGCRLLRVAVFGREAQQFLLEVIVVDAFKLEVLRDDVILLVQDGQHEVLGADDIRMELLGDDISELQYALSLLGQRQCQHLAGVAVGSAHRGFQFLREYFDVQVEVLQNLLDVVPPDG